MRAGTAHRVIGARTHATPPDEPRWDASLDFALERQNGLNWCWAAVAKGIVDYYGGSPRKQCEYATTFLRQEKSCCGRSVPPPRCDVAHDVDTVLAQCDVLASPLHRPVKLETLRRELERDRPVVALFRFPSAVHAVVICAVGVAEDRIGFCDPWFGPALAHLDASTFAKAYAGRGAWFYTVLTRPPHGAERRATVSLLRDRLPRRDADHRPRSKERSKPVEIDLYELDALRLANGAGLLSAERVARESFALNLLHDGGDASLRLQRELTALREEIDARLETGFDVRIVRCFALKLEALWFTDPSDTDHRRDHYVAIPRVPYYLEAGREYGVGDMTSALVHAARTCVSSIEANAAFVERAADEAAYAPDDPTR